MYESAANLASLEALSPKGLKANFCSLAGAGYSTWRTASPSPGLDIEAREDLFVEKSVLPSKCPSGEVGEKLGDVDITNT